MRNNRKADMTIQYTFLIFLATITVFVVIGLITKWSFNASTLMCKLSGECQNQQPVLDVQIINITGGSDCKSDFKAEIIKGARLCNENGKLGRLQGNEPICYVVKASGCSITKTEINTSLTAPEINLTNFRISFDNSNKVIISYSYYDKIVKID